MLHAEEEEEEKEEEKGCVLFHYTAQHSTVEKPPPIECIEERGFANFFGMIMVECVKTSLFGRISLLCCICGGGKWCMMRGKGGQVSWGERRGEEGDFCIRGKR